MTSGMSVIYDENILMDKTILDDKVIKEMLESKSFVIRLRTREVIYNSRNITSIEVFDNDKLVL